MTDLRKQAMALYTPPFRHERGYIWDSANNMVAEDVEEAFVRVLWWGQIVRREIPGKLQDDFGAIVAQALNEFYEKHGDWCSTCNGDGICGFGPDDYYSCPSCTPKHEVKNG